MSVTPRAAGLLLGIALASAAGCGPPAIWTKDHRRGCKLELATHVAFCPCALSVDLAEIPDRPDVETLHIRFWEDADPRLLARLTHLRRLEVDAPSPKLLEGIVTLSRVQELVISSAGTPPLSIVAKMRKLRKLSLLRDLPSNAVEKTIDLTPLGAMTDLRELRIEGQEAALDGLAALTSLPVLSLDWPAAKTDETDEVEAPAGSKVEAPAGLRIEQPPPPGLGDFAKLTRMRAPRCDTLSMSVRSPASSSRAPVNTAPDKYLERRRC